MAEGTSDFLVLWRASFYRSRSADGTADRGLKKAWGQEAWRLAERAIEIDPHAVEGHYYSALGTGVYSQGIGHFLLANRLLAALHPPARIVFVSSGTHDPTRFTGMPAPRWREPYLIAKGHDAGTGGAALVGRRAYTTSKLANVLCAYELSRRLRGVGQTDVAVNAYDPGLMPGSGLARDYGAWQRLAWRYLMPLLRFLPGVASTEDSGIVLARLAVDPAFDGVTEKYFLIGKEVPSSPDSHDADKAWQLWEASAHLVALRPDETILPAATA